MRGRNLKDVIGGLLFMAIGLAFFVGAFNYPIDTARNMGPGYFPLVLGALTMLVGLVIAVRAQPRPISYPPISWRALVAVLAGIAAFGLTMERFGLVPAVFATAVVSTLGDRSMRWSRGLILSVGLAAGTWLIFVVGLGLPIPAFRRVW